MNLIVLGHIEEFHFTIIFYKYYIKTCILNLHVLCMMRLSLELYIYILYQKSHFRLAFFFIFFNIKKKKNLILINLWFLVMCNKYCICLLYHESMKSSTFHKMFQLLNFIFYSILTLIFSHLYQLGTSLKFCYNA